MIKKSNITIVKAEDFTIEKVNISKIECTDPKMEYLQNIERDGGSEWAIFNMERKKVGAIGIKIIEKNFNVGEIRYGMKEEFRGKGIMTMVVKKMIEYWFNECNIHRIQTIIETTNYSSIKVAEKLNMINEGVLRDYCYRDNEYYNCYIFSIINNNL